MVGIEIINVRNLNWPQYSQSAFLSCETFKFTIEEAHIRINPFNGKERSKLNLIGPVRSFPKREGR